MMINRGIVIIYVSIFLVLIEPINILAQPVIRDTVIDEKLLYHFIHLNEDDKTILPWHSTNLAKSYDFVIGKTWDFWYNMRTDKNGLPYYMNHQVWRGDFNDRRGIGGDQFAMALSSFNLLYAYSGNELVKEEMKFIADYYLSHSLSAATALWPNIPYPYNTLLYSGVYDGDMIAGKNFTQPDKAGSFGWELLKLYKMTAQEKSLHFSDNRYLEAAVKIANTLTAKIKVGDENNSPLPFKVNAVTGAIGKYKNNSGKGAAEEFSSYTSNWSATMELFLNLIELKIGDTVKYKIAFDKLLDWMKNYPMKINKWGPFFEDVPGWSDTQINAITFAQFIMNHPAYFPNWKTDVKKIFNWVDQNLGNKAWQKYGVTVINEQTVYTLPGNSHSSRQASAELQYATLTNDTTLIKNATRQLSWATYMVDDDGKNCYYGDEVWMTDGYGDYIRHYLRSMAFLPELAPANQPHLLSSTSVIQLMEYPPFINKFLRQDVADDNMTKILLQYRTYDEKSTEIIKLTLKPATVLVNQQKIIETDKTGKDNWNWKPLQQGGLLTINHQTGNSITVVGN